MDTNMELAEKLVTLRMESGLTQVILAEKMKVSRQAISRWESGEVVPSADNLKRLSKVYNVPISYLLGSGTERSTVVAVAEEPEEPEEPGRELPWWRKPILIGVAIGIAIALSAGLLMKTYHIGYDEGVKDTTPTYPVHTDILSEENLEGSINIKPLSTPPANVLGEEGLEGTFDLTQ